VPGVAERPSFSVKWPRAANPAVIDADRPDLGGNLRHGDDHTFCPTVWSYLVDRFAVRSVLDVGCGEGHAVAWFNRLGVYAVGIDGLSRNVARAVHPIIGHDICSTHDFVMPVDLVWSCEVAEHIDEAYVDNYLNVLSNGKIVAMTHAVPGQGGYHHVNEQPQVYWVQKMLQRGYDLHSSTGITRNLVEPWGTYFRDTGMVFIRDGA
jgi:SAM-dependent methyltransferase